MHIFAYIVFDIVKSCTCIEDPHDIPRLRLVFPCPRPCRVDDANSPRPHTLDTGCGFFLSKQIWKNWKTMENIRHHMCICIILYTYTAGTRIGQHQTHHFRQHPEITHSSHFGRELWATQISSLRATRKTSFLSSNY